MFAYRRLIDMTLKWILRELIQEQVYAWDLLEFYITYKFLVGVSNK